MLLIHDRVRFACCAMLCTCGKQTWQTTTDNKMLSLMTEKKL
ncbi:unnamed protein product [Brassica rapa]|uniref:Uncharacterized protein n=1 Tax=Brassica campestris TaxID=3711 RepID=A0A8D9DCB8_BRACM|nr:unnamed protein product [Brassica rapa]